MDQEDDWIDYPAIVQEALRDAVRRVLARAADEGIPGDHHFFLAFRTDHPGVIVPRFLRDLYPEEVKIVLQHQYWDLSVEEESFAVTLSFSGQRQRLVVPFAALTLFVDPSAEFMLRFAEGPAGEELDGAAGEELPTVEVGEAPPGPRAVPDKPAEVLRFDPRRRK